MVPAATATLDIVGMHCGSCAALIETKLGEIPGVESVRVDLGANTAEVVALEAVGLDDLCGAIAGLGYGAVLVST